MAKKRTQTTLSIGENRGSCRLWIQGRILSDNGWLPGVRWTMSAGRSVIRLQRCDDGERAVAGSEARPVIDSKDARIAKLFPIGSRVDVSATKNNISIRAAGE